MGIIKHLSNTTINRIAAGEVVERPASVVKELVENSIDAGAVKIDITLEKAGKNLIVVSDNGNGMSVEDLAVAVDRHTTSKLNENDIMNINSFGFRGEALPSIASVSQMKIISKSKYGSQAHEISINGGVKTLVELSMYLEGTKIEVKNLFFATPARLKFLRSDRTEYAACCDVIKKLAISYPYILFSLTHDDKAVMKLKKLSNLPLEEARKERISEVLPNDFIDNAVSINIERDEISVSGFISLPTYNRASGEDQLLFVNNRPVKDKLLISAVRSAYQGILARDRYPVVVIFLNINPYFVDVNVHPTKNEVKFHNSNLIRGLVISSIKQALLNTSQLVSNITSTDASKYMKPENITSNIDFHQSGYTSVSLDNSDLGNMNDSIDATEQDFQALKKSKLADLSEQILQNKKQKSEFKQRDLVLHYKSASYNEQKVKNLDITKEAFIELDLHSKDSCLLFKNQELPLGNACVQLHGNYIIAQTTDGLVIVDQHAAHERITYEKLRVQFDKGQIIRQRLLIPEIVTLPDIARVERLCNKREEILELGMCFENCGDLQVKVLEIPTILKDCNVQLIVNNIADYLYEVEEHILLADMIEDILQSYSCYHSVRSGRLLTIAEMNSLLRQIENTSFSGQCNHGRPTYVKFDLKDIEKLFGRR